MQTNYAIDITLGFDSLIDCLYTYTFVEKNRTISAHQIEMEIDELECRTKEHEVQIRGTTYEFPGKKVLENLIQSTGVQRVEIWHSGGREMRGELLWLKDHPEEVRYTYLPDKYRPGSDDAYEVQKAFDKHKVTETIKLENLWE